MRPAGFCLCLAALALPAAARAQSGGDAVAPWETVDPQVVPPVFPPGVRAAPALQRPDPEGEGAESLARLRGTLAWFEGNHRSMRIVTGITGMTAGAVGILTGALLIDRGRRNDEVYGIAIGAGGFGMILGSAIALFLSDPLQPVRATLETSARGGFTPAQQLAAAEAEWGRRAERSRRVRRIGGPIVIGLGALMAGGGAALLIARGSSSATTTYAIGTMALASGGLAAVAGAGILFTPDPVEQGWEVYRRTRGIGVDLALAPVPGGAMAAVGGVF